MHSGPTISSEELSSLSCPSYSSQSNRYDLAFPSASRPGRLSTFRSGGEWCLEAPSDADLDDEQKLSAALRAEEDPIAPPLQAPHRYPVSSPIPVPSAHSHSTDVAISPAAMFLAAFTPSAAPVALPDDEGQTVAGYTLGNIIGYGGFSIIRRAFSASGGVVAVKIIRRSDVNKQDHPTLARKKLQHEAEVWSSLSHEHILPLFAAVHTSYADFFVTLFCPAGSMYDILKRDGTPALPQDDAGMMFRQVVRGLRYLHEVAMYVHRDIKLENVLVDEMGVCKIGDFGLCRKIGEIDEDDLESDVDEYSELDNFRPGNVTVQRTVSLAAPSIRRQARSSLQPHSLIGRHGGLRHRNSTSSAHPARPVHAFQPGSLPYAAPEILLPQTNGPLRPHPAQDIWALGVLLYALLTGHLPFSDSFEPRLQMKILHGTFELPHGIGKGAERVLQGCIECSTQQRWTISMVDEVAWGIGWGSEGDDVTPAESDDEFETHCRPSTRPSSRSRSRPPPLAISSPTQESSQEEVRTRPALEAASRRSASRVQRSQSRAPMPTHQSYSGRSLSRSVSHQNSRAPSPSPIGSALSNSITSSVESPFLSSPTSSVDRGRRLLRRSQLFSSRSPSPSVVPGTPVDFGTLFSASLPVVNDQPDELQLDSVEEEERRGRSKATRDTPTSPLSFLGGDSDSINIDVGHWSSTLERGSSQTDKPYVVRLGSSEKERSQSCGHSLRASSRGPGTRHLHHQHHHHHTHELYEHDHENRTKRKSGKRTGSTPSTPATPGISWSASARTPRRGKSPAAAIKEFVRSSDVMDSGHKEMIRSRSVDRGIGWR